MELSSGVTAGQRVVVIGEQSDQSQSSYYAQLIEQLKRNVGDSQLVEVQPISVDILTSEVQAAQYDHCYLFLAHTAPDVSPPTQLTTPLLTQSLRVLKLGGTLHVVQQLSSAQQSGGSQSIQETLGSALRLSGFVDVSSSIKSENSLLHAVAKKPLYETGTSLPLKLPAISQKGGATAAHQVWTLSASDALDNEDELIDSDTVLDESDFKKPDPTSLRAGCGDGGETTKRKACKNCTCGLADKLSSPSVPSGMAQSGLAQGPAVKLDSLVDNEVKPSSCGSCYLGDAFRCAGCPYLGMPAFKPGERVLLTDSKLQADL